MYKFEIISVILNDYCHWILKYMHSCRMYVFQNSRAGEIVAIASLQLMHETYLQKIII